MTTSNDKSGSPLHPSKKQLSMPLNEFTLALHQRMMDIYNKSYDASCSYQFYLSAIEALTAQQEPGPPSTEWQYGLFQANEWLRDQGDTLTKEFGELADWVQETEVTPS